MQFNPLQIADLYTDKWRTSTHVQKMKLVFSMILGKKPNLLHKSARIVGFFDYLTLFSFRLVGLIAEYSYKFAKISFQMLSDAFSNKQNEPWWYKLGLFSLGSVGTLFFFPIAIVSKILDLILNQYIVRPIVSFALAYLNPITHLIAGLSQLYFQPAQIARMLNPFVELKAHNYHPNYHPPHARTLNTTWWGKMRDTFSVIGGYHVFTNYPLPPQISRMREGQKQKYPLTNLFLADHLGLFDFLIVPALVSFVAQRCESLIKSVRDEDDKDLRIAGWVLGIFFIPLNFIINGLIRPLVSAVLTFNPLTAILVGLVSGITSIYQLIKYDGFTQEKAEDCIRESLILTDESLKLCEDNKIDIILGVKEVIYNEPPNASQKKRDHHVLYKAQIGQGFNINTYHEIVLNDNENISKAAQLLIDMDTRSFKLKK